MELILIRELTHVTLEIENVKWIDYFKDDIDEEHKSDIENPMDNLINEWLYFIIKIFSIVITFDDIY